MLLQKRSNGIFYFRWVYPPALRKLLGKRELIKSLYTTSKSQALARAGVHYMAVEKLKDIYLSLSADKSAWTKAFRAREDFFDRNPEGSDDIDQLSAVKQVLEECYDSDVPRYSRALLDLAEVYKPASLSDVQRKKELISSRLKLHREASTNLQGELPCGGSIKQELANLFSESICDPYEDEDFENLEFNSANRDKAQNLVESYIFFGIGNFYYLFWSYPELAATYLRDMEQVLFAYYSKMESNLCASRREPELPSFLKAKDAPLPLVVAASTESASIKFSELYAQFLTHKKSEVNLSDKMQGDYNDYVKTFLFAVGDKPISTINKKQIKEFLQGYQKLPRRNLKAYKYEPIETLWGLAVPEEHRIATRTMTSAKKFLSGVFRFAVNQGYLTESPVVDLALKTKLEKRRGNFTDLEVRKIFDVLNGDSHIQKNEWQKWAVLFGAYTGARASEIMGLQKQDFKQAEESGIWLVTIRGTKTANALRQFPLSQELVDKGFLDFVGVGHGRVFPSEKSNKAITAFFPRVLEAAGIPKRNDMNLERSFHSLRHTVVTKARGAGISDVLVQQVVGHEKTSAGITDNYTHAFTPEQLLPVVEAIKY